MLTSLSNWLKNNPISAFFALTFLIAWSIWLPLGLHAPENILLTLPGAWAPSLSAVILIGLSEGWGGIRNFLRKLFHWRVGLAWYLVVLFGVAALAHLAIGIGGILGVPAPEITLPNGLPRAALIGFLPIFFLTNIFVGGPLAEDIGWRGYILPKMRAHMTALNASLIIGVIWAVWHLPFFIFPWRDLVGNIPFAWFALLTTSWSVLFAWVYVNTESILMPVLFHAAINTTLGTLGVLGHGDGELIPLLLNIGLTWIAVGAVVATFGSDLQRKDELTLDKAKAGPDHV
ncbi:MAG TPA: type II CAAX endopeptidase family protein [Anaerolineales bacterium]|nr:type II CAAX endopeptidase family protein [Anaerolineales bacterium]